MSEAAVSNANVPSLRRLLSVQVLLAAALSAFVGIITAVQFTFGLGTFGGFEYAPRVLALSAVRTLGPGASTVAALYALLVWTHEVEPSAIRPQLVRATPQTLGLVLLTAPLASLLAMASGNLVSICLRDVPWDSIRSSPATLQLVDLAGGGLSLIENMVVSSTFCWFALPIMRRRSWSLLQKIGAVTLAFGVLRGVSHLIAG